MILIPIVDIYKYARWRRLENLPLNIATLTLSLLAWSRVTREKEKVKEARVEKPIECGKSFHLITQRDHKLTDKRPRKRAIFYTNSENMPTIKVYLSAICLPLNYKEFFLVYQICSPWPVYTYTNLMEWFIGFDCKYHFECDQTRLCQVFYIFYTILYTNFEWEREKKVKQYWYYRF